MKNRLIVATIIGVFVLAGAAMPSKGSAQTVDQSLLNALQTQIQTLLRQIQDLQKQLNLIRSGISYVPPTQVTPTPILPTPTPTPPICPPLKDDLGYGQSGDEVRNIQKFLAKDKNIYPEGLATGFYGQLTRKAVEKFQEKYGLEASGNVDEHTKEVLETVVGPTIGSTATGGGVGGGYACIIPPRPISPNPIPVPDVVPPVEQEGIRVISPTNGERWQIGRTYRITWQTLVGTTAPGMNTVSIRLEPYFACAYSNPPCSIAAMLPYMITDKTENDGVYEWTIPDDLARNNSYNRARITVLVVGQKSIYGKSGVFSVVSDGRGGSVAGEFPITINNTSTIASST